MKIILLALSKPGCLFFLFPWLHALTVLNTCGKSGSPCLVPDLREETYLSLISMKLSVGFLHIAYLEEDPIYL